MLTSGIALYSTATSLARSTAIGLIVYVLGSIGAHAEPVRGPDLVLWLDAQEIDADGTSNNNLGCDATVASWRDKNQLLKNPNY